MRIYAVECDGKISQEAYITLDSAKNFLKSRIVGRNGLLSANGWRADFKDGDKDRVVKILELDVKG